MFTRLGHLTVRRRRIVLALTALFLVVAAGLGSGVFDALKGGGFDDPNSESTKAKRFLDERFSQGNPNVVLLFAPADGDVDSPAAEAAGVALTRRLASTDGVAEAESYWTLGKVAPLRSSQGDKALVFGFIRGDEDRVKDVAHELRGELDYTDETGTVQIGGMGPVYDQMSRTIQEDLAKAETIAFPVILVLLVFIFGGVIAASLPRRVG